MKISANFIAIIILVTAFTACSDRSDHHGVAYLARVGSNYLTLEEAKADIPQRRIQQDSAKAIAAYRDQWIRHQLLLREAQRLNLDNQSAVQKRLQAAHDEILIDALQDAIVEQSKKELTTSDSEAVNYYRSNRNQLTLNDRYVKFRHIETPSLRDARQAREELQNDSSWTQVAFQFSDNAQKNINQSRLYWPVSSVFKDLPIVQQYVSRLDSGQISPIQRYEGIYHFIQLTDVKEQGETADPHWFTDQIKDWLTHEKQYDYYNSYVKNLYLGAKQDNELELYNVNTETINDKIDSVNTNQHNE